MMTISRVFSNRPGLAKRVAIVPLLLLLGGCAGLDNRTGSLYHTYSLMDDQGRRSGTLVTSPLGQMELRDANGNLVGMLVPDRDAKVPNVLVGNN
jgi:hypothetical protein